MSRMRQNIVHIVSDVWGNRSNEEELSEKKAISFSKSSVSVRTIRRESQKCLPHTKKSTTAGHFYEPYSRAFVFFFFFPTGDVRETISRESVTWEHLDLR